MTLKWHSDPMRVVRWAFCPSAEAWEKERQFYLRRGQLSIGPYPTTPGMATFWTHEGEPRILVTISEKFDDDPVRLVGTLAHEAYHLVCRMTEKMGDKNPSEEFVAYALDITLQLLFEDYSLARAPLAKLKPKKTSE